MTFDNYDDLRGLFPFFRHQPEWCYLDSAATTQMPEAVMRAMDEFQRSNNTSAGRGLYSLSQEASAQIEAIRKKVALFLGVNDPNCVAFTSGTTESINLVARRFLADRLDTAGNVLITGMEHHANLIPWQQVCLETGAELRVAPLDDEGHLLMEECLSLLDERTRLVAVTHISNALGHETDVARIAAFANHEKVPLLLDLAQSVALHTPDLSALPVDFAAFSAHKMFGPFGTGILYVHPRHHQEILPFKYGGGMIREVTYPHTDWLPFPYNMEGGTANITGVIGLGAAIDFLQEIPREKVRKRIKNITRLAVKGLREIDGIRIWGDPLTSGILSFTCGEIHPHDVAEFLAADKIAVRAGMHCAEPLMHRLGIAGTIRVSFSIYSNEEDVQRLLQSLVELKKFWK